jgi:solute:Na+ symporter, SSS family
MTLAVVLAYLALVLAVGLLSHRLFRGTGEDFFLASRSIGPLFLLLSLFGTHMTAFAILGASGEAYRRGIGVYGLMASSSAVVVPCVFFFVGIRLWSLGKRHGLMTQVEYFRRRYDSEAVGLALFAVLTALLIPYLLIGVLGGGLTLAQITGGQVPIWMGSLLVCSVVLAYVCYGGLRGTAWANALQTLVFMGLGAVAFAVIVGRLGGIGGLIERLGQTQPQLLVRGHAMPPLQMLSYTLIPLSAGMFPHIFMHWLTARSARTFRLPIVLYPVCIALVWVPSVLLGLAGRVDFPGLEGVAANGVLVMLIERHAPGLLAGLLAAGVFAAIMSSLDSQVLSLGTVFTRDIMGRYRRQAMDERQQIFYGRLFAVGIMGLTYLLSLVADPRIFGLAVWSFSGFSALFPLVLAALFWRRSTATGVLAAVGATTALWVFFFWRGQQDLGGGLMPVVVLFAVSALVLIVVSLLTRPPQARVLRAFFTAESI